VEGGRIMSGEGRAKWWVAEIKGEKEINRSHWLDSSFGRKDLEEGRRNTEKKRKS
jgi:hypothetical protein